MRMTLHYSLHSFSLTTESLPDGPVALQSEDGNEVDGRAEHGASQRKEDPGDHTCTTSALTIGGGVGAGFVNQQNESVACNSRNEGLYVQRSDERWSPGCVNAAGKARQKW